MLFHSVRLAQTGADQNPALSYRTKYSRATVPGERADSPLPRVLATGGRAGATGEDLRDVSDAKEEALRQWDARLAAIYDEYQTHPQRLRPLRAAMEERLLRAFASSWERQM